jgi:transmembrane sensor
LHNIKIIKIEAVKIEDKEDITPSENEVKWAAFLNGEPVCSPSRDDTDGFHDFEQTWELAGTAFCHEAADTDIAWNKLQKSIITPQMRMIRMIRPALRYAALVIAVLGISFAARYFVNRTDDKPVVEVEMLTVNTLSHPEQITTVTLPDGSVVKLNADTKLEYPGTFTDKTRRVTLSGEAFFEVTHDSVRPFVIDIDGASVEVLGTSFNVSAYPGKPSVEVNVESGKVRLTEKNSGREESNKVIIPAGRSGKLTIADGKITQNDHLSPNYLAWITKEINFQRTPLGEAFDQLESVYHVKINVVESDIASIPYTANFAKLQLDYILDVIARTHNLSVTRNDEVIVFARKK